MIDIKKYTAMAVIRYLNGDFDEYKRYEKIVTSIYKNECYFRIKDMIPEETKKKIYKVSSQSKN